MEESNKLKAFKDYMENSIKECSAKAQQLKSDFRDDEANLCKVRENIFKIFSQMIVLAEKASKNSVNPMDSIKTFFMEKLKKIPLGWIDTYNKTVKYNNSIEIAVSEEKLKARDEIQNRFLSIWED